MTPEEFEVKMQQIRDAVMEEDEVRILISRSMAWDRQANVLSTVQTARVYINRPTSSGRANWIPTGMPITVEPEKSRIDLLDALTGLLRTREEDPDLESP